MNRRKGIVEFVAVVETGSFSKAADQLLNFMREMFGATEGVIRNSEQEKRQDESGSRKILEELAANVSDEFSETSQRSDK